MSKAIAHHCNSQSEGRQGRKKRVQGGKRQRSRTPLMMSWPVSRNTGEVVFLKPFLPTLNSLPIGPRLLITNRQEPFLPLQMKFPWCQQQEKKELAAEMEDGVPLGHTLELAPFSSGLQAGLVQEWRSCHCDRVLLLMTLWKRMEKVILATGHSSTGRTKDRTM